MKNDLIQYMYFLRIDAEVEVLEMVNEFILILRRIQENFKVRLIEICIIEISKNDSEISAYTYEKTLKLHEREKLLKDLKVKESVQETEVT